MENFIMAFPASVAYISSAPYFWISMGMTTGIAMFIGAIIYDGELEYAWKGLLGIGMYSFFLFQVMFTRVNYNYVQITKTLNAGQAYANLTTVVVVSLFWTIGVLFGVLVSSRFHGNHRKVVNRKWI